MQLCILGSSECYIIIIIIIKAMILIGRDILLV